MGGAKRARDDEDHQDRRKRRAVYTEGDAKLAGQYNDLADEVSTTRLAAAAAIVKHVVNSDDRQASDAALTKLIKGVCSGRKAARLGFSVALLEVLRVLLQQGTYTVSNLLARILDLSKVEGNPSGQERRDILIGRRFAFQALLQSGAPTLPSTSDAEWEQLLNAIFDLATIQPYLRKECGSILYELLVNPDTSLKPPQLQVIADAWGKRSLWKTAEGVALWLQLAELGVKMPKHIWHHRDPFSAKERLILAKAMQDGIVDDDAKAGARQIVPSFAWHVVMKTLWTSPEKDFASFWMNVVDQGLFATTASNERKYLGLEVVGLALKHAPQGALDDVLTDNIIRCIMNHRAKKDSNLYSAAGETLRQITLRVKAEPSTSSSFVQKLPLNCDQATKTKTLDAVLAQADPVSLTKIVHLLSNRIGDKHKDNERRMSADMLVSLIKSRHERSDFYSDKGEVIPWVMQVLLGLSTAAWGGLPEKARQMFLARLNSSLGHLMNFDVLYAVSAPKKLLKAALPNVTGSHKALLDRAWAAVEDTHKQTFDDDKGTLSIELLICMSALQVLGKEIDADPVLTDLLDTLQARGTSDEWVTVLTEIVLSFTSKPSVVYKRLAEQAFTAFVPSMTADSMQSFTDILGQSENSGGQHELFAPESEVSVRAGADDGEWTDDDGYSNVEEDSDVEITNGLATRHDYDDVSEDDSKEDDSEETDSDSEEDSIESSDVEDWEDEETDAVEDVEDQDSDASDSDSGTDEEAAFDRKLAAALGTSGVENSDDDGSDMDDEQMLKLEPHLTKIFQERERVNSTKQENKQARSNIITFKTRTLDLLSIYVRRQYASPLALSIIQPNLELIRTSSSKLVMEKAFVVLKLYFDTANRNKAYPQVETSTLFQMLTGIHAEIGMNPSKLHASACSRSGLFLARILIAQDVANYSRVAMMYAELQSRWYCNGKSKIQSSIFTEWTSWSITTRRQK